MKLDLREHLSALIDGEDVPPEELAEALSAPDAAATLREFALLRSRLRTDVRGLSEDAARRIRSRISQRRAWIPRRWAVPALAAGVALVAGLEIGRLGGSKAEPAGPPKPVRELHFEPGVDWHNN